MVDQGGLPWDVKWRLGFLAGTCGLLIGFDMGSIGGALLGLQQQLHMANWQLQLVVAATRGAAIAGCLLSGVLMSVHGRRFALAAAALPFFAGPVVIFCSTGVAAVFLGRSLLGIGIGLAMVAGPRYLGEVAPPAHRGELITLFEMATATGFLVSSVAVLAVEAMSPCWFGCWRYQAGLVPLLAALPLLVAVQLVPESPRWFLSDTSKDTTGRFRSALEAMVRVGRMEAADRLRCADDAVAMGDVGLAQPVKPSKDDLVALWDGLHDAAGCPLWHPELPLEALENRSTMVEERGRARGGASRGEVQQSSGTWFSAEASALKAIWKDAFDLCVGAAHVPAGASRALALAVAAGVLNQLSGSSVVLVYAQELLKSTGVISRRLQDSLSIFVALAKVLGVAAGLAIVERVDRRQLHGWGGASCACWLCLLSVGAAMGSWIPLLCGACGFLFSFFCSWGVGFWVIATELTGAFGSQYSSAAHSIATAMLCVAGWAMEATFLTVMDLGSWGLCIYAAAGVLMALFGFRVLPETRGCTLEECAARVIEHDGCFYASTKPIIAEASAESDLEISLVSYDTSADSESEGSSVSHNM